MSRRRIDQLLPGFADGDAISNAAVIIRASLLKSGYESDIYAPMNRVSPPLRNECMNLYDYDPPSDSISICHYGISSPATRFFLNSRTRKILVYHNITPAEYFRGFYDKVADSLQTARKELPEIAGQSDAVWAVSRFNASELEEMGISSVQVFELPFSTRLLDTPPDEELLERRRAPLTTILFTGRIAPNKRIEDLIMSFAWYHKTINRQSRLLVVGSNRSCPRYFTMLRMMVGDLDMPNICLEGFASQGGLSAYYQVSDLYMCASEHEGYCLPLLEAMHKGLPVISRASGGAPEAMGGAGILYEDLAPRELAELMHLAMSDEVIRSEILDKQRKRVEQAVSRPLSDEIQQLLSGFIR